MRYVQAHISLENIEEEEEKKLTFDSFFPLENEYLKFSNFLNVKKQNCIISKC